jgi:hypothetical protein
VWQQAIHLAQGVAEQALAEQRQVLATERERVAAVEDQARQDAAQFRQQAAEAVAGRQAPGGRVARGRLGAIADSAPDADRGPAAAA